MKAIIEPIGVFSTVIWALDFGEISRIVGLLMAGVMLYGIAWRRKNFPRLHRKSDSQG